MKIYRKILFITLSLVISQSWAQPQNSNHQRSILAVVEEKAGRVDFYDSQTNALLGGTEVGSLPHEITLSSDETLAFVSNFGIHDYDQNTGNAGNTISVIDLHNFKEKFKLITGSKNAPHGLKIRPNHPDELYVNTEVDNQIIIFDLKTQQIKKSFSATPGTHNLVFSPDGEWLWLMSGKNGVTKMHAETGTVLGQYIGETPIRGITYTADKTKLLLSGKNEILFLDPITMQVDKKINNLGVDQILYSVMTPDSKLILAPAVWNNQILIIDAQNNKLIKRMVTGLDPVNITTSADSRFAFVTNARSRHVSKIDLKNFTLSDIETQSGPNGIALFSKEIHGIIFPDKKMKSISLGTVLPLTGVHMSSGRNLMLGYEFLRDHINQRGGIKIGNQSYHLTIYYNDTQSDDQHITTLVKELQDQYPIKGLFDYYLKDILQAHQFEKLAIIPFFAKLDQYNKLDTLLFNDFINQENFEKAFHDSLDLIANEENLRAFLSLSFLHHSLTQNLYLPEKRKSKPGIVHLHASSGVIKSDRNWANLLKEQGYIVFLLDSFTPRGYIDRKSIGWDKAYQAQIEDLNYAYQLIVNIGGADRNRIGLVGYSLGGYSVLRAMQLNESNKKIFFKRAASFYGHAHRFSPTEFAGKIGLFWGDKDDRSPLIGAKSLIQNAKLSNIQLFHYANAHHGFDNPAFPALLEVTDENGNIYHLGYNEAAHYQSIPDLLRFLYGL